MPFKWDAESERKLLLYIVKHCDVRPGIEAFNGVAAVLGEGVNSNACKSVVTTASPSRVTFIFHTPSYIQVFSANHFLLPQPKILQAQTRI